MIKALYRNTKNPSQDARQARRAEARRYEKERDERRNDWRDDRYDRDEDDFESDRYGEADRYEEDDFDARDDDRLAATTRRLARARERHEREPEFESRPRRWRDAPRRPEPVIDPDEIAENAAALVTRRVAASERHTARALENIAELIEANQKSLDPEAFDEAVAAFERRAAQTERKTAEALENIADLIESGTQKRARDAEGFNALMERLNRIESKIAQKPDENGSRPIRSALSKLESRIDRLSTEDRGAEFEQTLSGLDKRLAEIAARLDADARERQNKQAALASASPAAMDRGLAHLDEARPKVALDAAEAPPRAKRPLADAIAEIARRQNALDAEDYAPRPPKRAQEESSSLDTVLTVKRLEDLHAAVDAVTRRLEAIQSGVGDRANQQLVLMRQVDTLRRQIEESAHCEPPATARRFEQLGKTVESLSNQIERLSQKEHPAIARRFELLDETVGSLARHVQEYSRKEDPAAERRFKQLSEQVENLSHRIEAASQAEHPANARRFEQLSQQVDRLSRQIEEAAKSDHPVNARRFDQLGDAVNALTRQFIGVQDEISQSANRQERISRDMETLRAEIEELSHTLGDLAPRASTTAIESALHELLHRIDAQRDRGVGEAALVPVERLAGELRAVMKDLDPSPLVSNLHADVRAIARRLEEIGSPNAADAAALGQLSRQTTEVKELLGALASRPLPLEKLETRLFDLTQRVDGLSLATAKGSVREIDEVVKAIRSIMATETSKGFSAFNHRLEQLSNKLEDVVAKSGAKRFDELDARIENMHKSLAQRIDQGIAQRQTGNSGALENLVASLAKKIDAALEGKAHNPAFDELGRKIEKLEARIHDPAAAQSIARIETLLSGPGHEGHFKELARRIDNIGKSLTSRFEQDGFAHSPVDLSHIEDLVRRLGDRIDAALEPGAGRRDIEQLEHQVEQLSQKLDRLGESSSLRGEGHGLEALPQAQLNEISDRIDFMHNALAARIEAGSRSREDLNRAHVADLVEQLSQKMNSALEPNADAAVLQSLEAQIKELSRRLDRTDGNGAALTSIEEKITDLFTRIEETRAGATEAAEAAVRKATLDVLRQASSMASALNPSVKKEIDDIRRIQDEAGARTHETLSAVHETLERVVDRLAVFEDELTEIRSAPQPRAPAPEPAYPQGATRDAVSEAARPAARRAKTEPTFDALDKGFEQPLVRRGQDVDDLDLGALGQGAAQLGGGGGAQSAFIAAARRAAQQVAAQASAEEAARKAAKRPKPAEVQKDNAAVLANVGSTIMARKRPILLGLTALVMLVGAYQMAHQVNLAAKHDETGDARPLGEAEVATEQKTAPQTENAPAQPAKATEPQTAETAPAAPPAPKLASPSLSTTGAPAPAATSPLGLQPIGPAGGGPTMAPRTSGKSALGVDDSPVGAIGHSPQETAAAIKSLAMTGDAAAQYELGARYADGRGLPRDNKAAAEWFQKAADQGLAPAQYRLGSYYEKGVGVERDYARARKLYEQAAAAGNARAMHNLAVLAAEGNDGKPDYGAASDWFRRAAELGVRDSQYNLAILYARGLGVGQSLVQSYLWFSAAAQQGDADAAKKRDEVGARLDSKQLAEAKALVDGFKPRQPKREANDVAPPKGGWESLKAPETPPLARPAPGKPKMSQI